jgi:hypothetical protein
MSNLEQPGDLTNERLDLLAEIVGRDWLNENLIEYKEFRQKYSLESRWWHRPPDLSPVIPLVYFAMPGPRITMDEPFGVWQGDPSGILARLLVAIVEFKDYWNNIPGNLGWNNLQYFIRSPKRFYGFKHEISLATHLKRAGYKVEPYFFDPNSKKGMADIVIEGGNQIYDIQCKARNPSTSTDLSYDRYLYFAGRWARLVADSGKSYFLFLSIRQKIEILEIDRLLEIVSNRLKNNNGHLTGIKDKFWEVDLFEIGRGDGQTPPEELRNITSRKALHPLYTDLELLRPATRSSPPLVSGCYISGHRSLNLSDYVFSTAESAARAHDGRNPLIISINLYQEMDMSEYLNGQDVSRKYYTWCKDFFSKNRNVAMLLISSNYDRYIETGDGHFALAKKYLIVESQHWDNVLKLVK